MPIGQRRIGTNRLIGLNCQNCQVKQKLTDQVKRAHPVFNFRAGPVTSHITYIHVSVTGYTSKISK